MQAHPAAPADAVRAPAVAAAREGGSDAGRDALLARVLAAHGGLDAWRGVDRIDATLSTGGLAFALKGQRGRMLRRRVSVHPHLRRTLIDDYPAPGSRAEWQGDAVRVLGIGPTVSTERPDARAHLRRRRATFAWDELDLLYFVGYALWNYLSFPYLLLDPGVDVRAGRAGAAPMLDVRFPPGYPTHCARQYFVLDGDGGLRRHDYVAEVFGRLAAGANHCDAYRTVDGLRLYTRRHVVPSLGRTASLPWPTLVWIELDDLRVVRGGPLPAEPAAGRPVPAAR